MEKTQRLPPVDRSAEKLALAKKLGLTAYVSQRELLGMNFKPIELTEIMKKLGVGKMIFKPRFRSELSGGLILLCLFSLCSVCNPEEAQAKIWALWFVGIVSLFVAAYCAVDFISMNVMDLCSWKDEMPYGAFLAVKEARELGITKFAIYYPELAGKRVLADPVIVGFKDGVRLEIFSWDDGKIYE